MKHTQHNHFQHNNLDSQLHLIVQQLNQKFGHHTLYYANDLQNQSDAQTTKLQNHLEHLTTTCQKIDQQISKLLNSSTPNTSKILKLKKQKAKLKSIARTFKKRADTIARHNTPYAVTT